MSIEEYKQIMMIQYKRIFAQSLVEEALSKQKYAILTQIATKVFFSTKNTICHKIDKFLITWIYLKSSNFSSFSLLIVLLLVSA